MFYDEIMKKPHLLSALNTYFALAELMRHHRLHKDAVQPQGGALAMVNLQNPVRTRQCSRRNFITFLTKRHNNPSLSGESAVCLIAGQN